MTFFRDNPVNTKRFLIQQFFFLLPLLVMLVGVKVYLNGSDQVQVFSVFKFSDSWLYHTALAYTRYANFLMYFLYAVLLGYAFFSKKILLRWYIWYYVLVQMLITVLCVQTLKCAFGRARPDTGEDAWHFFSSKGKYHSFPSGHTAEMVTATSALAQFSKSVIYSLCWGIIPAFMGFTRIFLGRHYPSDVLGAALMGVVGGYFITFLLLKKKKQLECFASTSLSDSVSHRMPASRASILG